ncbi:hypothetical protein RPB_4304 [Rhodopseudomonas palustris HaA2]|uniref:Uncharacterized protein n=1 Tax=Rhodopseudomonas palustris (strain HaA2) TaxID=316058 RepID=Q2IS19_RHOP2|nr:hypothetical protein RPB_4304 [Rhodopseudomonas palustris HaA2]
MAVCMSSQTLSSPVSLAERRRASRRMAAGAGFTAAQSSSWFETALRASSPRGLGFCYFVMRGLGPRIHPGFSQDDGLPGQARQ